MNRTEVTVQIHAWLEERELPGLQPAFRARLLVLDDDRRFGVSSRAALRARVDDILVEVFGEEDGADR